MKNCALILNQIARINECSIEDTGKRLINTFDAAYASLITIPETEIVLCQGTSTKCETFDGTNSISIPDTINEHLYSCMALLDERAVIIAGYETDTVEELFVR